VSASRSDFSDRGQFEVHSAHVAFRAEVHHRSHPAYGAAIDVLYREKRGSGEVFVCTIADEAAVVVPAWMFDRAFCSRMTLGDRRASVEGLCGVRSILDAIRAAKPGESSGTVPSEVSDRKDGWLAPSIKSQEADGDRVSEEGRSRAEGTRRSCRASRTTSPAGRKSAQRTRGSR
jgi:hypothetical protein